jgi:serine protease Do
MKTSTEGIVIICIITIFFPCGCVHSAQFHITPNFNLNGFRYVYIAPIIYQDGSQDRYGLWNKTSSFFLGKGFEVINDDQTKKLSEKQQGQCLICSVSHFHSSDGMGGTYATVDIKCYDVLNRVVYGGKGKSQGLTVQDDLDGALRLALQGFDYNYRTFNASFSIDIGNEYAKKYANWEKINLDESAIINYLDENQKIIDKIEGIWTEMESKQYKIGIIKFPGSLKRDFVAIIIETNTPGWLKKQIKIEFEKTAYPNLYSATYYMSDHAKQGTTAILTEEGLLEFRLKSLDGTELKTYYIKNYPENINLGDKNIFGNSAEKSASTGSGFIISQSGLVITNYHVVKEKNEIEVIFPEIGKSFRGSLLLKDVNNDLAILRLDDFIFNKVYSQNIPYSILLSKSVKLGQKVYTLGYPLGDMLGKSAKYSSGSISSVFGIQDDPRVYQISNPVQPGNSGSPLFNEDGELIKTVQHL